MVNPIIKFSFSKMEDKYLVTTSEDSTISFAAIVDYDTAVALKALGNLYNELPDVVLKCVVHHPKLLVRYVKKILSVGAEEMEKELDWSTVPLLGISTFESDEEKTKVTYLNCGEAVRVLKGTLDNRLYRALEIICAEYQENPKLFYYALTKCGNIFEGHIRKDGGRDFE